MPEEKSNQEYIMALCLAEDEAESLINIRYDIVSLLVIRTPFVTIATFAAKESPKAIVSGLQTQGRFIREL